MKKEKISTALNALDEKYVQEAENYQRKKKSLPIMKWGALAASLAIVMMGTILVMPRLTDMQTDFSETTPVVENMDTVNEQETDEETVGMMTSQVSGHMTTHLETTTTFWQGTSAESSYTEQYFARISEGNYCNYAPMRAFKLAEAPVGEKLEDTVVFGFWQCTHDKDFFDKRDYTGEEEIETLRAEIYAIQDISPEVAVFVKYLDKGDALTTTHYYVFVNRDVENRMATLADFYQTFRADRYFSLAYNDLFLETMTPRGRYNDEIYGMNMTLMTDLFEMLLALDGTPVSGTPDAFTFEKQLTFDVQLDSVGSYSGYVGIYDNGHIVFNFYSTNHFIFAFDIGKEKAEAIISYVQEYAELKHSDGNWIVEETTEGYTFTGETVAMTTCTNALGYETSAEDITYETSHAYIPE